MKQKLSIIIPAIFTCILWGSAFVGAKIGFEYTSPIFLSGIRFSLAGLLLMPILFIKRVDIKEGLRNWRFMCIFALTQTFLQYGIFFMGLDKVPAATAAIIIGCGPLFVAIMAHIFLKDDKIGVRKLIAILIGLSGVIFISLTKGNIISDAKHFYTGIALLIISNIIGGYTNIMVVKSKRKTNPILLTSFANFFGGIMLLIVGLIYEKPEIKVYPIEFYYAVIWLAIIPAVGFSVWYNLLQKPNVKVSSLNMWKFVIPVTGAVLSWIILPEEKPELMSIIGIIIIIISLQILQLPSSIIVKRKKID